jgi:hypothetical protein
MQIPEPVMKVIRLIPYVATFLRIVPTAVSLTTTKLAHQENHRRYTKFQNVFASLVDFSFAGEMLVAILSHIVSVFKRAACGLAYVLNIAFLKDLDFPVMDNPLQSTTSADQRPPVKSGPDSKITGKPTAPKKLARAQKAVPAKELHVPVMDDPLKSTTKKSTVKNDQPDQQRQSKSGQNRAIKGRLSDPQTSVVPKAPHRTVLKSSAAVAPRVDSNEQQIRDGRKYLQKSLGLSFLLHTIGRSAKWTTNNPVAPPLMSTIPLIRFSTGS